MLFRVSPDWTPVLADFFFQGEKKSAPKRDDSEVKNMKEERQVEKQHPLCKSRGGRFQITTWKKEKVIPADDGKFRPERRYEVLRACVQYGRFNRATRKYENQQIWCNPDDLRDLVEALDNFGQDDRGEAR